MDQTALLIAATLASGTPLALAGLGLLINEKAGVLNLGAEGMMLVAAIAGIDQGGARFGSFRQCRDGAVLAMTHDEAAHAHRLDVLQCI